MSEEVKQKIADALNLLSVANGAMLTAIFEAANDNGGELTYSATIDESCGNIENRVIGGNEDNEWCIFDENGNEIQHLEDATADELYDICLKISVK